MLHSEKTETPNQQQEAERYRLLAEQSTDMISRHTATDEWTYIDVNPAVERLLGYKPEEIIGIKGYDLFHPDDADNLKKRAETVKYSKGMYTNTYRYHHKEGHYIWLETTSRTIRSENGEPLEIICVSRDVTEREVAQQAIRRLARVVESSSDMVMFCNQDSMQLTYLNEAAYRVLGTEKETPIVLYLSQLFEAHIFDTLVQDALNHASQHGTWYGIVPIQMSTKNNRIAEIREVICHRNRIQNTDVEYYSLIGRDITQKRNAEEQAKRQQLEMAHMSRLLSVGEMATGLAHEINQPLAAILNYCRGSMKRLEDGVSEKNITQVAQSMQLVTKQAKRAADIVKRMRSFVKRSDYQRIEFCVNESCRDVAEFLHQEAKDHSIQFIFELDPSDPILLADKVQIEQVLLNLMRNAIEAYSDCDSANRPVIVSTQYEKGYIVFTVKDEAKGITEEQLQTLFEPFTTSKPSGLGMGLAISQTIIETHGGQLWAESNGENGTQFHFKVPVRAK